MTENEEIHSPEMKGEFREKQNLNPEGEESAGPNSGLWAGNGTWRSFMWPIILTYKILYNNIYYMFCIVLPNFKFVKPF